MPVFVIVLLVVVAALAAGLVLLLVTRRNQRSNKNKERGLSMVNLRIHLPPISEDIDSSTRDNRDVVEENISRATSLYNLLTSIAEKRSLKIAYYGQEHICFEIIAKGNEIHFYASAPGGLVPLVIQAINSTYKSAKVEEVSEHNLFDSRIKPASVVGGELVLKENYAYPIATYLDSKQDIMKAILGALVDLRSSEGAGIQILFRPADKAWTKNAQAVAKELGSNQRQDSFFKDLLVGFYRTPESKEDSLTSKKEVSALDKSLIESIEKKITQPGFETLIRVVVSKEGAQKSRDAYNNILAAFALTNAPKSNGFKSVLAKKIDKFVNDFNLRIFPQTANKSILNTAEMATLFHLPDAANTPTSQLERQVVKQVDGPRNFLEEGVLLGHNVFRGVRREVRLGDEDRMRHMYVVGKTGVGKSVFLENMVLQDIAAGKGLALVDPHGETIEKILSEIPQERLDDVIYFNPGNMEYPMGFNIFEYDSEDQPDFLIQEAINMLYKLYDPNRQGMMGARYEYIFRNAAKLIMADPAGGTFIDIPRLFNDRQFVEQKLRHVNDASVIDFWRKEYLDLSRSSEFGDLKNWFLAKFSAFLSNTMMRNILGQTKSSFDLRQVMDEGKIMLINLSQGRTGELNMKLLGMMFVTKFQIAAMSRADIPEAQRRDFTLYVDEFQSFATESFANIFSAARKYRMALVVANQHTTQLTDEVRHSIFGNVGTALAFRIGAEDAEKMVKDSFPTFEIDDLTRLSTGSTVARTMINGVPTMPFNMETLPPREQYDVSVKEKNEKYLLRRHGRPRQDVEKEITARWVRQPMPDKKLPLPPTPALGQSPPAPPLGPPVRPTIEDLLKRHRALKDKLAETGGVDQKQSAPKPSKTNLKARRDAAGGDKVEAKKSAPSSKV